MSHEGSVLLNIDTPSGVAMTINRRITIDSSGRLSSKQPARPRVSVEDDGSVKMTVLNSAVDMTLLLPPDAAEELLADLSSAVKKRG